MQPQVTDLLDSLETVTADATEACPRDMCQVLGLIELRGLLIVQLVEILTASGAISKAELECLVGIEQRGGNLLRLVENTRDKLREDLCGSNLRRSFADCVTGVLNVPTNSTSFDL